MNVLWISISLIFAIAELGNPGAFLFLSFSIGALVSSFSSAWCFSTFEEISTFFITSFLGFIFLKTCIPIFSPQKTKTGVDALIGKKIDAITPINQNIYTVKIAGQTWSARFENNEKIDMPDIIVKEIKGSHLILKKGNS